MTTRTAESALLSGVGQIGRLLGGIGLIAGTCIGGGMLALPVMTALGGFVPTMVLYFLCWAFMACTGLLIFEACLWMEGSPNLLSLSHYTLGRIGKLVSWSLYLFLFYSLSVAYVGGCGDVFQNLLPFAAPRWVGRLLFVSLFSLIVYAGSRIVSRVNLALVFGLIISYFAFVILGTPHVQSSGFSYANWGLSLVALPIAFTSFAYQGTVPSLITYLKRDPVKVRFSILAGTLLALAIYVVWEWLILGIVPTFGPGSLVEAMEKGYSAIHPLAQILNASWVTTAGTCFAFFALTTSFLGVTLGLVDFLADGLRMKAEGWRRALLCAAVFIPATAISLSYPNIFLQALSLAGGYGCSFLLGLMPILIVWVGRYRKKLLSAQQLPGGRFTLVLLTLFVFFELGVQIWTTLSK